MVDRGHAPARTSTSLRTSAVVFLVALAGSSCVAPAAHELDLSSTTWNVANVGGLPAAEAISVSFDRPEPNQMTISADCGSFVSPFTIDTDGSAISIAEPSPADGDCPDGDEAVALVLRGVESAREWEVVQENTILLRGTPELELTR